MFSRACTHTLADRASAAAHCNTLQHTAAHCKTLQHSGAHYNTLQCTAMHCNTLQHTAYVCAHTLECGEIAPLLPPACAHGMPHQQRRTHCCSTGAEGEQQCCTLLPPLLLNCVALPQSEHVCVCVHGRVKEKCVYTYNHTHHNRRWHTFARA